MAEVFPELVVVDEGGKPETVKYRLLSSLLLGELQRVRDRHQAQLEALTSRISALESDSSRREIHRRTKAGRHRR